ncbi:MAG: hypothetical protein A2283_12740 [Lentisphaerae bacterium RIFOXYA12_FULL_48_11]|nr:MAG: hypothetical protein A2283_12740 [Lentisphaerae bacterium RIFOXYA12_FULL_48_11]
MIKNSSITIYLWASIWALVITLISTSFIIFESYYEKGWPDSLIYNVAAVVSYIGFIVTAMICQSLEISETMFFCFLFPVGTCVINIGIAWIIAFVITQIRNRRNTQQDFERDSRNPAVSRTR